VEGKFRNSVLKIISEVENFDRKDVPALMGFDACIDTLVRIISYRNEDDTAGYFNSTAELGDFLKNLGTRSCGLELETKVSRPGGNMVITANALGLLGVRSDCIGTFGYPEILPVFRNISPYCSLYSVADTITATALEFDVSKVIMFDPGPYKCLDSKTLREVLGTESIRKMAEGKFLTAFLNWSEIENSTEIWTWFLNAIFPRISPVKGRVFFTDLSDCSRKSKEQIREVMSLLWKFRKYFRVILSLNVNESIIVAKALGISHHLPDESFIKELHYACNCDLLLIHRIKDSIAFDGSEYNSCETFFCKDPKILTGGGDNFNAGFCYSTFFNLDLYQSLLLANAVTGFYIQSGHSPELNDLNRFLEGKTWR
jgi:hypothetical protein